MRLQPVSLRGRRFLIQYLEVMREFSKVIPWLDGMDELRFATDTEWFIAELMRRTHQKSGPITPYQFVAEEDGSPFIGGILKFSDAPENFRDPHHCEIAERLASEGSKFISCLQVREPRRGISVGKAMMQRAIHAIQSKHGSVWGVVSNPDLIKWYISLGAKLQSPLENEDRLWIVSWF